MSSVALAGTGVGTAAAEESYDQVVNIAEAGADTSGNEPIDDVVERYEEDDTLLKFPDGTYLVDQLNFYGRKNFALVATGDATLVPASQKDYWISAWNVTDFRFEGFTTDASEEGIHPNVAFGANDGLLVKDITRVGYHDGTNQAYGFKILNEDGSGLVENLTAADGGAEAVGAYVDTNGTITLRDCHLEEWGDNGLYASWSNGPVQVEGGLYRNNDISQVRLGSAGSYVKNARVVVDNETGEDLSRRGIRISDGPFGGGSVLIEDCDVLVEKGRGVAGIVGAYNGGSFTVRDTRIHVGEDYYPYGSGGYRTGYAIYVDEPSGIDDPGRRLFENVSVTGRGQHISAVNFENRNYNVMRNCCIQQSGTDRNGIVYDSSTHNLVENTTVNVPGEAIVTKDGGDVRTVDISYSGTCPRPGETTQEGSSSGETSTDASSTFGLADVPTTENANRQSYPTMGTSSANPTITLYGNYLDPETATFADGNLRRLVEEYVRPGELNVRFRSLTHAVNDPDQSLWAAQGDRLAQLGLAAWAKRWDSYWGFFEYVTNNQSSVEWQTHAEARELLESAGVPKANWIAWLADNDVYADLVDQTYDAARDVGVTYIPVVAADGDLLYANSTWDCLQNWVENHR